MGWGGQEIRILGESAGMAARGHRVTLIAPAESNIYRVARDWGVDAVALPVGRKNLSGLLALRHWLAVESVDVINSHSSTDSWLAALACSTLKGAPPIVRTRHISAPVSGNWPTRWLYRSACAFIVTTGEQLRKQVIAETGVDAVHVASVPTGIDLARFQPGDRLAARALLGLPAAAATVGIVATLRSWKGHKFLLEAVASLPTVQLVVVGDGPQRDALAEQAKQLGIEERVRFAGNQIDVVPWLQAFDIFVLPSYANEGVPQAIMQAMACALPVVSTDVGSISEIVAHDKTGVVVSARDAAALRGAIASLLDDAQTRARLGAGALAIAQERFSNARMLDRMEHIFCGVVSGANPV